MITPSGKIIEIHGKKFCAECDHVTDQTCFSMRYRKSEKNDDTYEKTERLVCDKCHNDKLIVKEIPEPTEKSMLVKLPMSLGEKYEPRLHDHRGTPRSPSRLQIPRT